MSAHLRVHAQCKWKALLALAIRCVDMSCNRTTPGCRVALGRVRVHGHQIGMIDKAISSAVQMSFMRVHAQVSFAYSEGLR